MLPIHRDEVIARFVDHALNDIDGVGVFLREQLLFGFGQPLAGLGGIAAKGRASWARADVKPAKRARTTIQKTRGMVQLTVSANTVILDDPAANTRITSGESSRSTEQRSITPLGYNIE